MLPYYLGFQQPCILIVVVRKLYYFRISVYFLLDAFLSLFSPLSPIISTSSSVSLSVFLQLQGIYLQLGNTQCLPSQKVRKETRIWAGKDNPKTLKIVSPLSPG